jgi:hypothetical protein
MPNFWQSIRDARWDKRPDSAGARAGMAVLHQLAACADALIGTALGLRWPSAEPWGWDWRTQTSRIKRIAYWGCMAQCTTGWPVE